MATRFRVTNALCVLIAFGIVKIANSHSFMTYPQGTAAGECRLGGEPQYGPVHECAGPCDLSKITGERASDP